MKGHYSYWRWFVKYVGKKNNKEILKYICNNLLNLGSLYDWPVLNVRLLRLIIQRFKYFTEP